MHNDLGAARELMGGLRGNLPKPLNVDVAVCTPFTLLYPMGKEIDGTDIKLGAQNCHFEPKGAFTGEISAQMLAAAGCTYVIIGHSERRHVFGETGDMLRKKGGRSPGVRLACDLLHWRTLGRAGGQPDRAGRRIPASGGTFARPQDRSADIGI
ncbi:MAG: triose-phosphate isomerase [Phycisphaerae bacterium]